MTNMFAYYYEREEMNTVSVSFAIAHTLQTDKLKSSLKSKD